MAAIANVVIKKSDGTTDVTFTALNGGGGTADRPAIWSNTASNAIKAYRHQFQMKAYMNGTKQARRVEISGLFPVIRTVVGADTLVGRIPVVVTAPIPQWATDAEINEAIDQALNFFGSAHIRAHFKSGYTPT